jgi:hypothetical protein
MKHEPSRRHEPARLTPAALVASLLLIAATPITKEMPPDIAMPILGRTVYGSSGDTVGRVVDVLVDAAGIPQAAVLDVGGFLGVGNRIIAVHWNALHFKPADKDHPITIDMPADEIAAAPEYTDTTAPAQVVVPHNPPLSPPGVVAKPASAAAIAASPATPPPSAPAAAPKPTAPVAAAPGPTAPEAAAPAPSGTSDTKK